MTLWPFGKKKRPLSTASRIAEPVTNHDNYMNEKIDDTTEETSGANYSAAGEDQDQDQAVGVEVDDQPPRQTSVQDITALPGLRKLDASPHLRPIDPDRPVIPYNLNLNRPNTPRLALPPSNPPADHPPSSAFGSSKTACGPTLQRKGSKKANGRSDRELREEHIRAMSAPMQIPKRPAGGNNELLRRDSKKARRTLSKPRPDDPRASNVSLPVSVPSIMSARSEQRGWLVGGIDLLSPRPTVRLSHPTPNYQPNNPPTPRNKGKLPAIALESAASHRRRIADLADNLDSTSLRTVMERDARRQEQKLSEQHDRVERKLRKRAEKQRAEEERQRAEEGRERDLRDTTIQPQNRGRDFERRVVDVVPPTAVHPAFRDLTDTNVSVVPLTPRSMFDDKAAQDEPQYGRPRTPFSDPEPEVIATASPFADPHADNATVESWSPIQTPLEEPVLHTARAVRLSQGHMSPPDSPLIVPPSAPAPSDQTDTQTRRASNLSSPLEQPRRTSESSTRRAGTWAAIFRRGANNSRTSIENSAKQTPTESSFANVSRDSMSRQAIPAHLVRQRSSRTGTSGRTQSRFREDLPDVPMSPPDSRVQSPELSIAAANAASARRIKQNAVPIPSSSPGYGSEQTYLGRTDSPVVSGPQLAEAPLSQSLASVDSEGSWISGRPQRQSTRRVQRNSTGSVSPVSMDVPDNDFTVSYERLPVPDHELFNSSQPDSSAALQDMTRRASDGDVESIEGLQVRRGTAHHHPTVVHNDPRFRSREGLVALYSAAMPHRRRSSSVSSIDYTPAEASTIQKATSINYGHKHGHAKTVSAGSAKMFTISKGDSRRGTPVPSPQPHQTEFE